MRDSIGRGIRMDSRMVAATKSFEKVSRMLIGIFQTAIARNLFPRRTSSVTDNGMKRSTPFMQWKFFAYRKLSSSSHQSTSLSKSLEDRLPSRETWTKAWRWFLWVPAIIFVNDHVISLSPVNGISMRPTVKEFYSYFLL